MCGITGFCDFNKKLTNDDLVNMTEVLHHRGPDDVGQNLIENEKYRIGLGHKRLSIQDLSVHGHQPMQDSSKRYTIVYNGEVYNFKEFYSELEADGVKFVSNSDTEVILNLYIKYGNSFVEKLIGMFAIAIYDSLTNKIKLFIDRAGVKPIYYTFNNGLFAFSSELKSFNKVKCIQKEIDYNSLGLYFQYSYIPAPYSIFKNIKKLTPGHFLELNLDEKSLNQTKYWDLSFFYNKNKLDENKFEIKEKTKELLKSAFSYRMVSDVPVGVFLSGGYDSTAVASILQEESESKIKTFSIGFENKDIDEAPFAKDISKHLGSEHFEYYVTEEDSLNLIKELSTINDEPMGDVSSIPTYFVSKLAKNHVTVALSGDGGDEIFGGYTKYFIGNKTNNLFLRLPLFVRNILKNILSITNINIIKIFSKLIFRKKITNLEGKVKKFINILSSKSSKDIYKISNQYYMNNELNDLIKGYNKEYSTLYDDFDTIDGTYFDKAMCTDFKTYMYQILMKVDRASMAVSLESREPLLDHRIIEYVSQIPSDMKLENGAKGILKDIVHDYVPKELLERPKQGFVPPYENWLKGTLKSLVEKYSTFEYINTQDIFNFNEIVSLKDEFYTNNRSGYKLWLFLTFQLWYEEWMNNEKN